MIERKDRMVGFGQVNIKPMADHTFGKEIKYFGIALLYSLSHFLKLGYGLFDFSKWIQMLQVKEEYYSETIYFKPIAGLQSLISLYLLILWVTSSFKI